MTIEQIILVRDKTRLEQLIERFNSKAQARFYLERSGGDFSFYELEHQQFYKSLEEVKKAIIRHVKIKILDRSFLPTYIFTDKDLVVVLGQDGLVANTAKYVNGIPIIGVNPDPEQYDGVLLKHESNRLDKLIKEVINDNFTIKQVTMAKATLSDGQSLLAFNDFYIGADSHISSKYNISFNGKTEQQSSSGIIVSTGAGSTGWLSSVFNMANNINQTDRSYHQNILSWEEQKLMFVVREPFLSKTSQTGIGFGVIKLNRTLTIESKMPKKGVIFSDGIESDFLNFNSGSSVEISIADQKANLVI